MAVGIDHLDADRLLFGAAQLKEGIDHARTAAALGPRKIQRGLLDERDEDWVKRKIFGEIVEARRKLQHIAFSDFLFEQHRRAVRQTS